MGCHGERQSEGRASIAATCISAPMQPCASHERAREKGRKKEQGWWGWFLRAAGASRSTEEPHCFLHTKIDRIRVCWMYSRCVCCLPSMLI